MLNIALPQNAVTWLWRWVIVGPEVFPYIENIHIYTISSVSSKFKHNILYSSIHISIYLYIYIYLFTGKTEKYRIFPKKKQKTEKFPIKTKTGQFPAKAEKSIPFQIFWKVKRIFEDIVFKTSYPVRHTTPSRGII